MGVNSTALLCGLAERGIRPDLILAADTGGEKPETYAFRDEIALWLPRVGFPELVMVRNDGMYSSLEDNCLRKQMLPSKAYGYSSCSDKYKIRPQNKYCNNWLPARACWAAGGKVQKAIGYDAGEPHRAKKAEDDRYRYWYPLIEWDWAREECLAAIQRHNLSIPVKSACWFCPASTKREVLELADKHPELMARALAMEQNAAPNLQTVKGLGRKWAWKWLLEQDQKTPTQIDTPPVDINCACSDGDV
jgi:hypothetical protein